MIRKKYVILCLSAFLMGGGAFSFFKTKHENQYDDFRCSGATHYFLENEEVMVNQDLRISRLDTAYLTLQGYVSTQEGRKKLHRIIYMTNGKKVYKNSYIFNIRNIHKSVNDKLNEKEFEPLLMELTGDRSMISFDISRLSENSYLIGTPLSYIFTCDSY